MTDKRLEGDDPLDFYPDSLDSRAGGAIALAELNLQGRTVEIVAYKQTEVAGTETLIRQEHGR